MRGTVHEYTRYEGFPHRCLEVTYISTLLRDGFGFDGGARGVTFAFDIAGAEVEWTMGMMLVEGVEERAKRRGKNKS